MNPIQEVERSSTRTEETQGELQSQRRHRTRGRDGKVQRDVPKDRSQIESKNLILISKTNLSHTLRTIKTTHL